jgi:outer membrane protein assembly factor BamD
MRRATSHRSLFIVVGTCLLALAASGCRSRGEVQVEAPDKLYASAANDLRSNNYRDAIKKLEALESHYPFSNPAKQGQLDLMFAYYKNGEGDSAVDQADQFIRENPTHPRVDYAYYIKGLVYYDPGAGWLEGLFHADVRKRPPHEARKSLQAFQSLVQLYPRSPYAADSRQRMIFLRNKLADYDLTVAEYYVKRQAYVAAVNRARGVIENYDGSPAALRALKIMSTCYQKLGITDLAKVADSVYAVNKNLPDVIEPTAGLAGVDPAKRGDTDWPTAGVTDLAGRWEALIGSTYANSATTDFKGGTKVTTDSGMGFNGGVQYHFTNQFSAGAQLSYDSKGYKAQLAGEQPGEVYSIKGNLKTTSLMVDSSWNFMTGRWSPFVTAAVGWSSVNTDVNTGPPDVGCWWSPWYGYICTAWQKTKTESGFSYEAGLGLRYDINDTLAWNGSYRIKWVGFDNATGTPRYDGFQLNLGWKF